MLNFSTRHSAGIGLIFIEGLEFQRPNRYDLLGKLWSSVRKIVAKKYGVDIAATFYYDGNRVSCNFLLNYRCVEDYDTREIRKKEQRNYETLFTDHFLEISGFFENVIENYIGHPYGMAEYERAIESGRSSEKDLDAAVYTYLALKKFRPPKSQRVRNRVKEIEEERIKNASKSED